MTKLRLVDRATGLRGTMYLVITVHISIHSVNEHIDVLVFYVYYISVDIDSQLLDLSVSFFSSTPWGILQDDISSLVAITIFTARTIWLVNLIVAL